MEKSKILIIDDEKGPRESLRMILKDQYEIVLAEGPLQGLELAEAERPEVVFLDIKMPEMEGTEVLRRLKIIDPEIEVAMITAYAAVESAQEAVRHGAIDYLTKPFGMADVLRVAERAVARREERREKEEFMRQLQHATRNLSEQLSELRRKSEFSDLSTIYEGLTSAHTSIESQLDGMARLRAIGEIAAEVAHDVDNYLSAILMRIEILLMNLKQDPALLPQGVEGALQEIAQATNDSAHAIARISLMSGDPYEPSQALNINEILEDAVKLSAGHAPDGDEGLHVDLDLGEVPPVMGNAGGLRTALMNVMINARQALEGGGELHVRTFAEGGDVVVEIRDTGVGIPEELLEKVTQPFFTTKGTEGSGLGLSIARKVVSRHEGDLSLASRQGEGTTVTIRLPVGEGATCDPAASAVPEVLVVDDDERLLRLIDDYLTAAGLSVGTATSGAQGLRQFEQYLTAFHRGPRVVVTDARMPDLLGTEVARRIKELAPDTRILLLSAYVADQEELKSPYLDATMHKPFDLPDLLKQVAGLAGVALA
ncbi:MAG TPA: response regulator [Armatimonadota bacterium]|jgi:signal transduction histidine kinase